MLFTLCLCIKKTLNNVRYFLMAIVYRVHLKAINISESGLIDYRTFEEGNLYKRPGNGVCYTGLPREVMALVE